jgi:hypothetical protein
LIRRKRRGAFEHGAALFTHPTKHKAAPQELSKTYRTARVEPSCETCRTGTVRTRMEFSARIPSALYFSPLKQRAAPQCAFGVVDLVEKVFETLAWSHYRESRGLSSS